MATPKEQCFQDAVDAWEQATGKGLNIDFEQPWIKDAAGTWERGNRTWWALVNSWRKTLRWIGSEAEEPGTVRGLRRPDITMPGANGKDMVVDLKFTDKNGNPDPWRKGQKDAYRDINKQNQGGDSDAIGLDKESCGCKGEPEKEPVADPFALPQPGMYFVPVPVPGGLLGPATAPAPTTIPLRFPIPIFGG
jgi:hypothetical protein